MASNGSGLMEAGRQIPRLRSQNYPPVSKSPYASSEKKLFDNESLPLPMELSRPTSPCDVLPTLDSHIRLITVLDIDQNGTPICFMQSHRIDKLAYTALSYN